MMRLFTALAIGLWLLNASAVEPLSFSDPEKEARYKVLAAELRCLVCQNQNLLDSNAELAGDLRNKVHQLLEEGSSDQEIVDYMVARYGDFVLYRPPLRLTTVLLWTAPLLLVVAGFLVVVRLIRRNAKQTVTPLSDSEQEHLDQLLDQLHQEDKKP